MLSCPYKQLLGFDCPGCGMQRSCIELLKGNFSQSLALYPALLPVIFTLLFSAAHLVFKFRYGAATIKYAYIITMSIVVISYTLKMSC